MAMFSLRDEREDEEEISDEDEALDEDMEALKRACMLTGTNPNEIKETPATATANATNSDSDDGSEEFDDLELARSIQQRFALSSDDNQPLVLEPLKIFPPIVSDDDEDDFETLRAIERRFAKFDSDALNKNTESRLHNPELVRCSGSESEHESPKIFSANRNYSRILHEEFPDSEEACNNSEPLESFSYKGPGNHNQPSGYIEWHRSEDPESSTSPPKYSSFPNPRSVQLFIDAIKKNRSCQNFIRSKLIQIEARIEENKQLKERVKLLKDFQVSCKRRAGRVFSQKKDARVQLISVRKSRTPRIFKDNDKKVRALYLGPIENSHEANYRMALTKFPLSLNRQRWSEAGKENLGKGINQQFQEMMLQKSLDLYSGSEESFSDSNALDNIIASITDVEITPENVRSFLPKVDWERLASMYAVGRSGAECEARWLNSYDPLINHSPWTNIEDKNILFILQQRGLYNWIDIATTLGTNRTPFQCLVRYQRSLNAYIMKRDWTVDDDAQLRAAVETFGEHDWQLIAFNLEGRTGTQCSNRWRKTLNPARERVGRWTVEEDKRLKVAVMLFGPKTWKKIAQFIPGRTQVQCRERWVNALDPSLNLGEWTEEEDTMLKTAIAEHGHYWSKVAASIPPRTDSQCRRRWKVLLPHEVPLLQAERRIQKAAFISNFVDREVERPALCPSDFLPLPGMNPVCEAESRTNIEGKKKRSSGNPKSKKQTDMVSCISIPEKKCSKKSRTEAQIFPEEVLGITNGDDVEAIGGNDRISKKKARVPRSKKNKCAERVLPEPLTCITNGDDAETFGGNDVVSKKARKPRSKKNKCAEPAQGHEELPLFSEPLTCITNGNDVETFRGNDTVSKKAGKPRSKKNKCAGPELGQQDLPLFLEPLTCTTNGDNVESFGGVDTSSQRKKVPKPPSKGNKCTESAQDHHETSSSPKRLKLSRTTNGDNVETLGVDTSSQRKKVSKPPSKRNRQTESADDHQGISSSPKHLELPRATNGDNVETLDGEDTTPKKKRKAPKSHSKRGVQEHQDLSLLPEQSTVDVMTISFNGTSWTTDVSQTDRPTKSMAKDTSCSKEITETREFISLRKVKQGLRKGLLITSSTSSMFRSESSEEQHQPHDANGLSVILRVDNEHPEKDLEGRTLSSP